MECECLPKCIFFNDNMKDMPATAGMYKKKYCLGNNSDCARFMVFKAMGTENVPKDLFPNHIDRALRIIKEAV